MTANHIDQLKEWYESAERITKTNLPGDGDFIIYPHRGGIGYIIERSEGGWASNIVLPDEPCRILARAPKPRPAWHYAAAVIAHTDNNTERRLMAKVGETAIGKGPAITFWEDVSSGRGVRGTDLREVTPLIEARVTDGTVSRIEDAAIRYGICDDEGLPIPEAALLALANAALGITPDTEENA